MRGTRGVLGAAFLLVLGCSADPPPRLMCLEPPWVPMRPSTCPDERHYLLQLPGSTAPTMAINRTFLDAHVEQLFAIPGMQQTGQGSCCHDMGTDDDADNCLNFEMLLCTTSAADLESKLSELKRASPETADVAFVSASVNASSSRSLMTRDPQRRSPEVAD